MKSVTLSLLLFACLVLVYGDKEHEHHGGRKPHNPVKHEHYHDGEHDEHYDHEAILGKSE